MKTLDYRLPKSQGKGLSKPEMKKLFKKEVSKFVALY